MNQASLKKLNTCHPDLIRLALAVDKKYPVQVSYGHRNKYDQDLAYKNGHSKLQFPKSKHNEYPSLAVDFLPDPDRNPATVDWNDIRECDKMCDVIEETARELNINVRMGRYFSFVDRPHVELLL